MFERIGNSTYKHWNVHFTDIMKLKLDVVKHLGVDQHGEPIVENVSTDFWPGFFDQSLTKSTNMTFKLA